MKLVVVGTGYVGLVTGACLAASGHDVVCVDKDHIKISRLGSGLIDIYEPMLSIIVQAGLSAGRLTFTTCLSDAISSAEAVFVAVGTPASADGSTNLSAVKAVAHEIGMYARSGLVVIVKSTVPVGTSQKVGHIIKLELKSRCADFDIPVVSNPEFLREGMAVADFTKPDRIVIGSSEAAATEVVKAIYSNLIDTTNKIFVMDTVSAELTKYTANAMLATKISFINEIANIAELVGADIEKIRRAVGADHRIGYEFLYPGCGYGGSCFPKDVSSLIQTAKHHGYDSQLLAAVHQVNERQKNVLLEHLLLHFDGDLEGRVFAVWGLAFKPGTDDIREAPSCTLMEGLWNCGASVRAYDPAAMTSIAAKYRDRAGLYLATSAEDALTGAHALIICTDWKEFRISDYTLWHSNLINRVIIDGRNLYDPQHLRQEGFIYYGIGRGESCNPQKPYENEFTDDQSFVRKEWMASLTANLLFHSPESIQSTSDSATSG